MHERWPRRAAGALALLCDSADRVALVEPVSHDQVWNLVGGAVEEGEDPREALTRVIHRDTGLARVAGQLLVTEWMRPDPARSEPEGMNLIFAVAPLVRGEWDSVRLPSEKLKAKRLTPLDDIGQWASPPLARRIRVAMKARATGVHEFLPPAY
ncbi:NUDIX hydrolase [Streptomyces sp. MP131-18]|uniref:NUDIX domain-containing protein n=1 Tax=Streptomyces sp. MP131-18 TaxID=1857892 RepID=UPI001568DB36|nr:NUDIX hydrolase [Streptomyces sp. MP131-18]